MSTAKVRRGSEGCRRSDEEGGKTRTSNLSNTQGAQRRNALPVGWGAVGPNVPPPCGPVEKDGQALIRKSRVTTAEVLGSRGAKGPRGRGSERDRKGM